MLYYRTNYSFHQSTSR